MLEVIALSALAVFCFSVDYAYRLGLSKRGDQREEIRSSMFIDLAAVGISLGFILGALVIRLTGVEDDFARSIIGIVGAALGFLAVGIVGDKSIARFFGVDLQDLP
jgi:hypothetical protein